MSTAPWKIIIIFFSSYDEIEYYKTGIRSL